jgi:aromatic ring hydroxylase
MIRTGDEYWALLQDGREIYTSGERVKDVTTQPVLMVRAIISLLLPLQPKPEE